ncbi:hypothetical protein ACFE04_023595 [Oxalis oulophora]
MELPSVPSEALRLCMPCESLETRVPSECVGWRLPSQRCFELLCFQEPFAKYAHKVSNSTLLYQTTKGDASHEPFFMSTVIVHDVKYKSLPQFMNRKAVEQSATEIALMELTKSRQILETNTHPLAYAKNFVKNTQRNCTMTNLEVWVVEKTIPKGFRLMLIYSQKKFYRLKRKLKMRNMFFQKEARGDQPMLIEDKDEDKSMLFQSEDLVDKFKKIFSKT